MRTSATQFQLMVEFMERYGDLSKPSEGPQGRATNTQRWTQLSNALNSDPTGDSKTAEKWRKVWSDLKNNTKKKAARIYKAAKQTGGGPASTLKFTSLEEKVLALVGTQAATGIVAIPEIGIEEEVVAPEPTQEAGYEFSITIEQHEHASNNTPEDWNRPGTSAHPAVFPPLVVDQSSCEPNVHSPAPHRPIPIQEHAGASVGRHIDSLTGDGETADADTTRLTSGARRRPQPSPTPLPPTPRRRRRGQTQNSTSPYQRRTRTSTQSDLARQAFVRSDCEWRAFQQETERERNRIRLLEIRNQERWMDLFGQFLGLGNRILDELIKKK